jgi:Trk K+ transport system NAD-binding subunit
MKFLFSELAFFFDASRERNIAILLKFSILLLLMVVVYSVLFHVLMLYEGQMFSWITGVYWTLTVMSTLGFGDITFHSDLGRLFSMLVLLSGMVFLLIILPFTFIQFFYAPWLEAQAKIKTPRRLPEDTRGHVILTSFDPFSRHLVTRLIKHRYSYAFVVDDVQKALEINDLNYKVVVGELGDPQTYTNLRVEQAALVVANAGDMLNTNIVATIREVSQEVPIVANADLEDSVDILQLAGGSHVFQFMKLLGQSLARKTLGIKTSENTIGAIEALLVSEAPVLRTPLQGRILSESRLRETTGLNIIGLWEQGGFIAPQPDTRLDSKTVLLLAGSKDQLERFDRHYGHHPQSQGPVLILGGGRVGTAVAETLDEHAIDYRIIEKNKKNIRDDPRYILGSGADIQTLNRSGIQEAPSIIITTHDDDINIYLTIYCRKLRPDIQIISRANTEGNVPKLHSAGADQVMSYFSIAASKIFNLLKPHGLQVLAEGVNLFRKMTPPQFVGKALSECHIRRLTGCNLVAIKSRGAMRINPEPSSVFQADDELFLVGSDEAQQAFLRQFSEAARKNRSGRRSRAANSA